MDAQIKFAIVGHHSRKYVAEKLAVKLDAMLFMDDENHGSNWNHRRVLEWSAVQKERVIVLEDDALPVRGFEYLVYHWIDRFPDNIVSFYLGTGRPPHKQLEMAMRLIDADKQRLDYIMLPHLFHGVCYSVPNHYLPRILENWDERKGADSAITDKYKGRVIYPVYSLVDHADLPVVEVHPDGHPRRERRKAWRLFTGGERWPD